ncbi:MAG: histidinol-phosphate aminotransferase [Eubacteriaceae bacterium]|jgi:histidinol-phosphate aminotransferase|nr:histidinol-phosphate aminotransferase [Eubacteriaceae bacterium]MDK2935591.1 histidinol-phosphate aminotransferase [Eubacteriaceae bacterium]MDK2961256.1 histidinol-phosphate aminotransferase [Eubacteriaceae bacterium]MDN5306735.1 histidinol-phosphate aminotransferase [Eubacteriaceae bacterium]
MKEFTRENIKNLVAYKVDAPQYEIIVNANESAYDFPMILKRQFCDDICNTDLNRYPEACFPELLEALSDYTGVPTEGIICGSGSDEVIALINQAFVDPGDVIVSHSPSFSMYEIWSSIANANYVPVPDLADHIPDLDSIIQKANELDAKIIYLCNPNNPTGYTFSREQILKVLNSVSALLILDEAYIEFFGESSVDLLKKYPNLLVLRTFSKAFGLAGIRCGYALGNKDIIDVLYKVKGPYNLNVMTQKIAVLALKNRDKILSHLGEIRSERETIKSELESLKTLKIYPSGSNFIFFETPLAQAIYQKLLDNNILIKWFKDTDRHPGSIRFSIGKPSENQQILSIIRKVVTENA